MELIQEDWERLGLTKEQAERIREEFNNFNLEKNKIWYCQTSEEGPEKDYAFILLGKYKSRRKRV